MDIDKKRIEQIKLLYENYKAPFKYDSHGIGIWDAENNHVADVRGWGRLQYLGEKKGLFIQDSMGYAIAESLTREWRAYKKFLQSINQKS